MEYLTEENLGNHLNKIYPNLKFIKDKMVLGSNLKCRADYCNYDEKIIVEFDGYRHYNNSKTILSDFKKDNNYQNLGFKIIRIPYFVQMSTLVVYKLFGEEVNIVQTYKHGFHDDKALLPCDFCLLGIQRFEKDLIKFHYIFEDIKKSILEKINILGDYRLVIPESLKNLFI